MRSTIPRRLSKDQHRGDHRDTCDYCGSVWMRSNLVRDGSGLLACPDDQAGLDTLTLDKLNAEYQANIRQGKKESGRLDTADALSTVAIHATSADDW